jgi:Domain of Unknown Function (DUF1206)
MCRVKRRPSRERSPVLTQSRSRIEEIEDHAERAVGQAGPWVGRVARLGYIAKGVIYAAIGFLALREVLGMGGRTTDPSGMIHGVGTQPFGGAMLALLAVGLACYALWKIVQGIADPDGKGSDAHGLLRRVAYVGSGILYGVLAYTAAQSIFGAEDTSEDAAAASAMAIQPPLGPILVGLVGAIVVGVGLYQLYAAYEARFRDDLRLGQMGESEERWVVYAGRFGTAARAVAIGVAGAFLILAAYHSDPSETRGLGAALETVQHQPLGPYMLGAVAFGLLVYGAFMFAVAYYRRIGRA